MTRPVQQAPSALLPAFEMDTPAFAQASPRSANRSIHRHGSRVARQLPQNADSADAASNSPQRSMPSPGLRHQLPIEPIKPRTPPRQVSGPARAPAMQRSESMHELGRLVPGAITDVSAVDQELFAEVKTRFAHTGELSCDRREYRPAPGAEVKLWPVAEIDIGRGRILREDRIRSLLGALLACGGFRPIKLDRYNSIEDGFHRYAFCEALGIERVWVEKTEVPVPHGAIEPRRKAATTGPVYVPPFRRAASAEADLRGIQKPAGSCAARPQLSPVQPSPRQQGESPRFSPYKASRRSPGQLSPEAVVDPLSAKVSPKRPPKGRPLESPRQALARSLGRMGGIHLADFIDRAQEERRPSGLGVPSLGSSAAHFTGDKK